MSIAFWKASWAIILFDLSIEGEYQEFAEERCVY